MLAYFKFDIENYMFLKSEFERFTLLKFALFKFANGM
jgi:hypothetical protein